MEGGGRSRIGGGGGVFFDKARPQRAQAFRKKNLSSFGGRLELWGALRWHCLVGAVYRCRALHDQRDGLRLLSIQTLRREVGGSVACLADARGGGCGLVARGVCTLRRRTPVSRAGTGVASTRRKPQLGAMVGNLVVHGGLYSEELLEIIVGDFDPGGAAPQHPAPNEVLCQGWGMCALLSSAPRLDAACSKQPARPRRGHLLHRTLLLGADCHLGEKLVGGEGIRGRGKISDSRNLRQDRF